MEELDLVLEEKNVLLQQMIQMKTLEESLETRSWMNPRQLEELELNIHAGEQRLWELDKILEDMSRHKDTPDD